MRIIYGDFVISHAIIRIPSILYVLACTSVNALITAFGIIHDSDYACVNIARMWLSLSLLVD